jgi:hypothetical protein
MIGMENAEEVLRDREKWKEVVVVAMDFNGL